MKFVKLNVKGHDEYINVEKIVRFLFHEGELLIYLSNEEKPILTTGISLEDFLSQIQ